MKHHGNIVDYTNQRMCELFAKYKMVIGASKRIYLPDVYHSIVNMPCSRFWVSPERAVTVISAIMKGRTPLSSMHQTKREMFMELYQRVIEFLQGREVSYTRLQEIITDIVYSPAPKFYLSPGSAKVIINKAKKKICKKARQ